MRFAISVLEKALEDAEGQEVVNRLENRAAHADAEGKNAAELRQAIGLLRAHVAYRDPVWPAPKQATD